MELKATHYIFLVVIFSLDLVNSGHQRERLDSRSSGDSDDGDNTETCTCRNKISKRLKREISQVTFNSCPSYYGDRDVEIGNITVSPNPVTAPGDMYITFTIHVKKSLPANLQVYIEVHKYLFNLPFRVFCTSVGQDLYFGSCTYKNICDMMDGSFICGFLERNNYPCGCEEITPGFYNFTSPLTFSIPQMNSMFDILIKGDYRATVEIMDGSDKSVIGCFGASWSISKVHRNRDEYFNLFGRRRRQLHN